MSAQNAAPGYRVWGTDDVVANQDCLFLKLTAERFQKLVRAQPEVVAPSLHAVGRTLSARIRADNKRSYDFLVVRLATDE